MSLDNPKILFLTPLGHGLQLLTQQFEAMGVLMQVAEVKNRKTDVIEVFEKIDITQFHLLMVDAGLPLEQLKQILHQAEVQSHALGHLLMHAMVCTETLPERLELDDLLVHDIFFLPIATNELMIRLKLLKQRQIRTFGSWLKNRDLGSTNAILQREQDITRDIFNRIIHQKNLTAEDGLEIWHKSVTQFSGDVVLSYRRCNGNIVLLMGDFTGHGLHAAMGALPTQNVFNAMMAKILDFYDILYEINDKLVESLPTGLFMAAFFAEYIPLKQELIYINAGLPSAYILEEQDVIELQSENIPLGILRSDQLNFNFRKINFKNDAKLLVYTDGVEEVENKFGETFNLKFNALIKAYRNKLNLEEVKRYFYLHTGFDGFNDDLTLIKFSPQNAYNKGICLFNNINPCSKISTESWNYKTQSQIKPGLFRFLTRVIMTHLKFTNGVQLLNVCLGLLDEYLSLVKNNHGLDVDIQYTISGVLIIAYKVLSPLVPEEQSHAVADKILSLLLRIAEKTPMQINQFKGFDHFELRVDLNACVALPEICIPYE